MGCGIYIRNEEKTVGVGWARLAGTFGLPVAGRCFPRWRLHARLDTDKNLAGERHDTSAASLSATFPLTRRAMRPFLPSHVWALGWISLGTMAWLVLFFSKQMDMLHVIFVKESKLVLQHSKVDQVQILQT